VEGVVGRAVALDLGVDARAAGLGALVLLEHEDARALAHDEPSRSTSKGATLGGIVVARRERLGEAKPEIESASWPTPSRR
jgi:hypothetical protein